jgi:hypothetical protein
VRRCREMNLYDSSGKRHRTSAVLVGPSNLVQVKVICIETLAALAGFKEENRRSEIPNNLKACNITSPVALCLLLNSL